MDGQPDEQNIQMEKKKEKHIIRFIWTRYYFWKYKVFVLPQVLSYFPPALFQELYVHRERMLSWR